MSVVPSDDFETNGSGASSGCRLPRARLRVVPHCACSRCARAAFLACASSPGPLAAPVHTQRARHVGNMRCKLVWGPVAHAEALGAVQVHVCGPKPGSAVLAFKARCTTTSGPPLPFDNTRYHSHPGPWRGHCTDGDGDEAAQSRQTGCTGRSRCAAAPGRRPPRAKRITRVLSVVVSCYRGLMTRIVSFSSSSPQEAELQARAASHRGAP